MKRRNLMLLVFVISIMCGWGQSPPNGTYTITAVHSGHALAVENASTSDGANIIQATSTGATSQQWEVTNLDGTYYSIINVNSGSSLDVFEFSTEDGGNIVQWPYWGGENQQWVITGTGDGDGSFYIESRLSAKVLDVEGISTSSGANILQWEYWGNDNQQWIFTPVGSGTESYSLNTSVNGSGSVSPSGGAYEEGTQVTLTASPSSGWEVSGWSGVDNSSGNTATVTMNSNRSVTVNFSETSQGGDEEITLQENQTGFCGVDGDVENEHSGYTGDGFSNTENESGTGIDYKVDVGSSGTYSFEIRYASGSGDRPGAIQQNGSTVLSNVDMQETGAWDSWTTVTVSANLSVGVSDLRLEATGGDGLPNIDYVRISGSNISAADCGSGGTTEYNLSTNTSGSGSISLSPSGGTYDEGTSVTVTANPSGGWEFSGWSGDLSGSNNQQTIFMDSHKSVTAIFNETNTGGGDVNFSQVGYSTLNGGTTGGAGGTSVTCSTGDCILDAISDKLDGVISGPLTINVNGTVNTSNTDASKIDIKDVDDVSILGVGTSGVFDGVGIKIWRASNVIIRNVTIHHVSEGDGDCISIEGPSDHIWVDHCELYNDFQGADKDFYDGLLDVKRDADYITFSWNYLHDSWKTSLSGSSDGDDDHRRITYHHNWFENNNSRLPLFRFGEAHIFNNYYNGIESTGINSRMGACVRVENNYFENAQNPIVSCYSDEDGFTDETGNIFGSNITWDMGSDCSEPNSCNWNQAYSYSSVLNSASEVPNIVMQNSGVGKVPELNSASTLANSSDAGSDILSVMNYPNPVTGTTTFSVKLANSSHVTIALYNSMGQKVAVAADNVYEQGINEITYDAGHLAAGVYIYHVETDNGTMKKSLIIQ